MVISSRSTGYAKGLEESYAPGKRFNDHQDVNLISGPVSVQACTKCSYVGNDVNDMICASGKPEGSPHLTSEISRYEVAIRSEQEPRGLMNRRKSQIYT